MCVTAPCKALKDAGASSLLSQNIWRKLVYYCLRVRNEEPKRGIRSGTRLLPGYLHSNTLAPTRSACSAAASDTLQLSRKARADGTHTHLGPCTAVAAHPKRKHTHIKHTHPGTRGCPRLRPPLTYERSFCLFYFFLRGGRSGNGTPRSADQRMCSGSKWPWPGANWTGRVSVAEQSRPSSPL